MRREYEGTCYCPVLLTISWLSLLPSPLALIWEITFQDGFYPYPHIYDKVMEGLLLVPAVFITCRISHFNLLRMTDQPEGITQREHELSIIGSLCSSPAVKRNVLERPLNISIIKMPSIFKD